MENDYRYTEYYGKQNNNSEKKPTHTEETIKLRALLNAVYRTLVDTNKKTQSVTNIVDNVQNEKKTDELDETLKKKHKVPRTTPEQKDKTKSKSCNFDTIDGDNVVKLQQEINDLPLLIPLSSFASQSENAHIESVEPVEPVEPVKSIELVEKENENYSATLICTKSNNNLCDNNIMETTKKYSSDSTQLTESIESIELSESTESTDYFSFDDLIVNLKFLASIGKRQKLSSSTGNLDADKMLFGTVTRWFF
jgi:hypothetical protein